jgi:hypothetical protein
MSEEMMTDINENTDTLKGLGKEKLIYAKGFIEGLKARADLDDKKEEAVDDG